MVHASVALCVPLAMSTCPVGLQAMIRCAWSPEKGAARALIASLQVSFAIAPLQSLSSQRQSSAEAGRECCRASSTLLDLPALLVRWTPVQAGALWFTSQHF